MGNVDILHMLPAAATVAIYLGTGAANVSTVVLVVINLVQFLKAPFDHLLDPAGWLHDWLLRCLVCLLCLLGVGLVQAVGPIGLGSGADILALGTQTMVAVMVAFGSYRNLNNGQPQTPHQPATPVAQGPPPPAPPAS